MSDTRFQQFNRCRITLSRTPSRATSTLMRHITQISRANRHINIQQIRARQLMTNITHLSNMIHRTLQRITPLNRYHILNHNHLPYNLYGQFATQITQSTT